MTHKNSTDEAQRGMALLSVLFVLVVVGMATSYLFQINSVQKKIVTLRHMEAQARLENYAGFEWFLYGLHHTQELDVWVKGCETSASGFGKDPCLGDKPFQSFAAGEGIHRGLKTEIHCRVYSDSSARTQQHLFDVFVHSSYGSPEENTYVSRCSKIQVPLFTQ